MVERAARLLDNERAAIGHEIHDALLPLIFAASANIAGLLRGCSDQISDEARERLQQTCGWLDEALVTGRELLTQVYPPDFAGHHWTTAVVEATERLESDAAQCVQWNLAAELNESSEIVAGAAYRIVIEAVRNALRHGKASEVTVHGTRSNDGCRIVVRDNGVGFDPSQVAVDRFGIRSMIGRAQLVGGKLQVDSKPGGPTTVTFTAP